MCGRKPEITEEEFAGYFCWTVGMKIQNNWASILEDINKLMGGDDNNVYVHGLDMLHFVLPFMAIKIRELPCLLEKGQADRIREYVLESISEGGHHPTNARERMEEYQKVWDDSLNNDEPPHIAVANEFLKALVHNNTGTLDPIVAEGVGQILVGLYPGLLKEMIGNYRKIVP